ncbi:unnamed protein product [Rotaria sp. Silwood1]|nr:unnamed protein product [Rotaria sp. Silwood1]CAF1007687.1 unnamed protein product [Rotaria sp. Silwood1]CAF3388230.1 unnamed protein product [Rotaria sp. Silwood1]CAF5009723.1 unnamed protein product [Rotaria sp. Silwood1]
MENISDNIDTIYRYYDASGEPCTMLAPIHGFDKKPLVSLEQAVEQLIPIIPDIQIKVDKAKKRATNNPENDLSIDEAAAITLYTMEWDPYTNSLYYILNSTLREEDRSLLKSWFLYLKLLITALSRLPTISRNVYRAVVLPNCDKYQQEDTIVWWGFSSCSIDPDIPANEQFFRENDGERILFIINCLAGKNISKYSFFQRENEILLLPATTLKVVKYSHDRNSFKTIYLKEIQSLYPLIDLPITETENKKAETSSLLHNIRTLITTSKLHFNSRIDKEIARLNDRSLACLFRKRFTDNDLEIIVKEVILNKQCRVLSLRGGGITSQGATIISNSLESNGTLEELYLNGITIGDAGAEALANVLSNGINSYLKRLCLNDSGITDNGAKHLAIMLKGNKSLTHLWLPSNHINDQGIQCLTRELINNNNTLQELCLEWNKFTKTETVDILMEMIEKNQTLRKINLNGHSLSRADNKRLHMIAQTKKNCEIRIH